MSQESYPVTRDTRASVQGVVPMLQDTNNVAQPLSSSNPLPVTVVSGGGGGSSLADVLLTDSNGILFVGRDTGGTSGTIFTFYRLDTQAAYTPVGTIKAAGNNVVTVADGADVTQGAIADAAVAAGASGTVSAKVRALSRDIGTMAANVGTVTPTDASGKITTGGTAQSFSVANAARRGYWVQNLSTADFWVNEQGNAVIGASTPQSFRLPAGAYYESPANAAPSEALSIIGATTGQQFAARTW